MSRPHDNPGAVILGGSFPSVAAARNLAKHGVKVCVLGSATSVARFSRSVSQFATWPRELKEDKLPGYLVDMAEQRDLQGWVLFPTSDEHVLIVAQHSELLARHFVLTTPSLETVRFLYDKRLTYQLAQEMGVAIPQSQVPENADQLAALDVEFPVVLKPAVNSRFLKATHKKAYRADSQRELQTRYEAMSQLTGPSQVIVQEFLPEPSRNLFSFAGYFQNGEPVVGLSAKRTRQLPLDFGRSSSLVEAVELPELERLSSQLLRAINYTGLAELEFMWNAIRSRFELLDVNPRFWAWHGLAIAAGLDHPYVAFAHALGQHPPIQTMRQGLKWIRLLTDVRAAALGLRSGQLSVRQYLASLRGPMTFAVFSPSDPMPSIAEPFLLILERLRRRTLG